MPKLIWPLLIVNLTRHWALWLIRPTYLSGNEAGLKVQIKHKNLDEYKLKQKIKHVKGRVTGRYGILAGQGGVINCVACVTLTLLEKKQSEKRRDSSVSCFKLLILYVQGMLRFQECVENYLIGWSIVFSLMKKKKKKKVEKTSGLINITYIEQIYPGWNHSDPRNKLTKKFVKLKVRFLSLWNLYMLRMHVKVLWHMIKNTIIWNVESVN